MLVVCSAALWLRAGTAHAAMQGRRPRIPPGPERRSHHQAILMFTSNRANTVASSPAAGQEKIQSGGAPHGKVNSPELFRACDRDLLQAPARALAAHI